MLLVGGIRPSNAYLNRGPSTLGLRANGGLPRTILRFALDLSYSAFVTLTCRWRLRLESFPKAGTFLIRRLALWKPAHGSDPTAIYRVLRLCGGR